MSAIARTEADGCVSGCQGCSEEALGSSSALSSCSESGENNPSYQLLLDVNTPYISVEARQYEQLPVRMLTQWPSCNIALWAVSSKIYSLRTMTWI